MGWRRLSSVATIDDHPNAGEIAGVLGRVPRLSDQDLRRLSAAWRNSAYLVAARDRALSPTSPLILDVLVAFDRIATLYAEDLAGEKSWISLPPPVTETALKAVRDAVAAAYARPALSRGEYHGLIAPWRKVFPWGDHPADEVEDTAELKALVTVVASLAERCHEPAASAVYAELAEVARRRDIGRAGVAREAAWLTAVGTHRRRPWTLLRANVRDALRRPCPVCHRGSDNRLFARAGAAAEAALVAELCADAACALLVSDSVAVAVTEALAQPVIDVIPLQRPAAEA